MTTIKLFAILIVGLIATTLMMTTVSADSMYVGGKEYQLDPNVPAIYQYIAKDDPVFEWHDLPQLQPYNNTEKGYVSYRVEFTSLQWLTPNDVDKTKWRHNMTILVPWETQFTGVATMYITGCHNDDESCPDKQRSTVDEILVKTRAPLAILNQIPQEPVAFAADNWRVLKEDAIIAYTWAQYLRNPTRPDWVIYFPMAKAAVMAQRVLKEWSQSHPEITGPIPYTRFYVAGASKRGATTWFVTAFMGEYMPQNIIGAAPMVFDTLNFTHSAPSMVQQLGGFTFAFKDYAAEGLVETFNHPDQLLKLASQIDPLQPALMKGLDAVHKLVISATGDEFFLPLNSRYYYRTLKNKLRLDVPNADHILVTGLDYVYNSVAGHFLQLVQNKPLPQWQHTMNYHDNSITLIVSPQPTSVSVFKAFTPPSTPVPRMDFRLVKAYVDGGCLPPSAKVNDDVCFSPTWWNATPLEGEKIDNLGYRYTYQATPDEIPTDGTYMGFVILAAWENHPEMGNQVYSTQVGVSNSEKFPFPDCRPHCEAIFV